MRWSKPPAYTVIDKWPDEPWQVAASNTTGHLISGVFPSQEHTHSCEHGAWKLDLLVGRDGDNGGEFGQQSAAVRQHFCETKERKEAGTLTRAIMFGRTWFFQFLMGFIHSERFPEATARTLSWTASQHRVSVMLHMIWPKSIAAFVCSWRNRPFVRFREIFRATKNNNISNCTLQKFL